MFDIPRTYSMETERLYFRIPSKEDSQAVFEAFHSDGFMDGMTSEPPETKEAVDAALTSVHDNWQKGSAFVFSAYLRQSSAFVGRVGIRTLQKKGTWVIFYYVHPSYQRRGYASEAAHQILEFGFTKLDAQSIEAFHAAFNKASQRVLEKLGMNFVETIPRSFKKRGEWVADKRFRILRKEWVGNSV